MSVRACWLYNNAGKDGGRVGGGRGDCRNGMGGGKEGESSRKIYQPNTHELGGDARKRKIRRSRVGADHKAGNWNKGREKETHANR
jgi:hypothetical protein